MFHAGTSLVLAVLAVLGGLQAAGAFARPATGLDTSRLGAVVLVPGYGGNTESLELLAARIRALGRPAVLVRLPGQGTGDLQAQAAVLNDYVSRELHDLGAPVDMIGYSAGGVVARLWDIQYNGAQKARRIITLGSPLHGTRIATAGSALAPGACPPACQELIPGSTLLTQLRKAPVTGRPAWLSLWSGNDQVVRPPTSSLLPGAVNVPLQSVCPTAVVQHAQLPTDPLVIGIVLRSIGFAPLTVPNILDCASLQALGRGELAVAG
jgi:pimeloyl-ACP methyl ester carboxylesterase